MGDECSQGSVQRVMVFQERGSGEKKIAGIELYAPGCFELEVVSLDDPLPTLIDDPEKYLPEVLNADLVLGFLCHPDLSAELLRRCQEEGIPFVASAKKYPVSPQVATPPI